MENPLFDALLEAGAQSGQGVSDDLNGFQPEGLARLDRTATPEGRRCSAAEAHLMPALGRPNLTLATRTAVERVEIDGAGVASGVVLDNGNGGGGDGGFVGATRGVVLSAGAIKTPQLLMLSGVGPRAHLEEHGLPCVADLPGVGANLMDHACINTAFACERPEVSPRH